MAAVSSLSEKLLTTTTKKLQSSGDSYPAVSRHVQTLVQEVLAWQRRIHNRRIPNRYSRNVEERNLGHRFAKVLLRRHKAVGKEPSRSQLLQSEASLVNSVPGVPPHGCSATASYNNSSMGAHHSAPFSSSRGSRRGSRRGRKQSSLDSHPVVSRHGQTCVYVQTVVKEVLAWQRCSHNRGRIPNTHAHDVEESKLGNRFAKLLLRRDKALGRQPCRSRLSPFEAALVNSVRGVPLHGSSVKSSCSNRGDQLETGRSKVRKKPATGSSCSSRGSRSGRKKVKAAASDACSQAKRRAITDVHARAGAMAAMRKPLVQAGGGSGNGSGGVHSTAVAADAKINLLSALIS